MTAKEQLLEFVAGLSEEEAIDTLPSIYRRAPEFPPAPPEVIAQLREALAAAESGAPRYSTQDVRRYVGLE